MILLLELLGLLPANCLPWLAGFAVFGAACAAAVSVFNNFKDRLVYCVKACLGRFKLVRPLTPGEYLVRSILPTVHRSIRLTAQYKFRRPYENALGHPALMLTVHASISWAHYMTAMLTRCSCIRALLPTQQSHVMLSRGCGPSYPRPRYMHQHQCPLPDA